MAKSSWSWIEHGEWSPSGVRADPTKHEVIVAVLTLKD